MPKIIQNAVPGVSKWRFPCYYFRIPSDSSRGSGTNLASRQSIGFNDTILQTVLTRKARFYDGRGRIRALSQVKSLAKDRCDGTRFRAMVADGSTLLARRARVVDALNVFPVPDGDTGTNMVSTMRAAVQAAQAVDAVSAGEIAAALAQGALMGAHGNSGAILSQYLRGLARGLEGCLEIDATSLARALAEASAAARRAVDRPVEGTMLTIACDVARVATERARSGATLEAVLSAAAREASEAVERTRGALPVLREANVVDAGAFGLATILEGFCLSLRGEPLPFDVPAEPPRPAALDVQPQAYGYCTEFVIRGAGLDLDAIRSTLRVLGDSVVVVGDGTTARVHLHTFQPTQAIEFGSSLGAVDQVKVDDMQDQNRRLRESGHTAEATATCGLVVVCDEGFGDVFRGFDATPVIETPATSTCLADRVNRAVETTGASQCVVLSAETVLPAGLNDDPISSSPSGRSIEVVLAGDPSRAVAAALAFQPERSAEENARAMRRALVGIRTARIAAGAADSIVGLIDGSVVVSGDDVVEVALDVLDRLGATEREVITLYRSDGLSSDAANALEQRVRTTYPTQQVESIGCGPFSGLLYVACE